MSQCFSIDFTETPLDMMHRKDETESTTVYDPSPGPFQQNQTRDMTADSRTA